MLRGSEIGHELMAASGRRDQRPAHARCDGRPGRGRLLCRHGERALADERVTVWCTEPTVLRMLMRAHHVRGPTGRPRAHDLSALRSPPGRRQLGASAPPVPDCLNTHQRRKEATHRSSEPADRPATAVPCTETQAGRGDVVPPQMRTQLRTPSPQILMISKSAGPVWPSTPGSVQRWPAHIRRGDLILTADGCLRQCVAPEGVGAHWRFGCTRSTRTRTVAQRCTRPRLHPRW